MMDDAARLGLRADLIEVVCVEFKTNDPCRLNGPWTDEEKMNVHRLLAAIGCVPRCKMKEAADALYHHGTYTDGDRIRVRFITVGGSLSPDLRSRMPEVIQMTWKDIAGFLWDRLNRYREAKRDTHQWDAQGLELKRLAAREPLREDFVRQCLNRMGVR